MAGADEGRETFELKAAQGRLGTAEDEGSDVVVLGADLARKFEKRVGDTMVLRDREFTIVGIMESTLTAPDTTAWVPLKASQELLAESAPLFWRGLAASDLASQIVVYPEAGTNIAELTKTRGEWVEQIQPRLTVLTNMHVDMDYQTLRQELPEGVAPGFDGLRLEFIA